MKFGFSDSDQLIDRIADDLVSVKPFEGTGMNETANCTVVLAAEWSTPATGVGVKVPAAAWRGKCARLGLRGWPSGAERAPKIMDLRCRLIAVHT